MRSHKDASQLTVVGRKSWSIKPEHPKHLKAEKLHNFYKQAYLLKDVLLKKGGCGFGGVVQTEFLPVKYMT